MKAPATPAEAVAFLTALPASTIRLGLDRTFAALEALGNPQARFPALHLAGTNGKGSTCAFAESILRAQGHRVGLYTSPHLVRFNERIQVGGAEISDQQLGERILEVQARYPAAFAEPYPLTYFELGTAVALWHFARERVEMAVLETGLGGRLDATNACQPRVTAITALSLDHTEYLGPTLSDIAFEKAGIFKPGVPAIASRQPGEALEVLKRRSVELGISLWVEGQDFALSDQPEGWRWRGRGQSFSALKLGLRGAHQAQNAAVALACIEQLGEVGFPCAEKAVREGLERAHWPGRLEELSGRPTLLLDGAHNPGAMDALVAALGALYAGRRLHGVFGVLADKDYGPMMAQLLPRLDSVHLCPVPSPRSLDPQRYVDQARRWCPRTQTHRSVEEALRAALLASGPDDVVLCTGSLYLVGAIKAIRPRAVQWLSQGG